MIYVVIPIYNRLAATLECLACLARQTLKDYQIIIIDDGSTDGSAETIRAKYPLATILKGDGNLWWTGAMHLGISHVLKQAQEADFVLSLNNDVTFKPDYLEILVQTSRQHNYALVGSLCLDNADQQTILDSGIKMTWPKYIYSQIKFDPGKKEIETIDTISGRGVLIPIKVIKKIGNFAKDLLPHYGADYEYGFRAKAAGCPLVVSYQAVVYLKKDLTGFRPTQKVLSYQDYWRKMFNIKSPSNLPANLKIISRHCPGVALKVFDLAYLILGNCYLWLKNTFLYTLIKLKILNEKNG